MPLQIIIVIIIRMNYQFGSCHSYNIIKGLTILRLKQIVTDEKNSWFI